MLRFFRSSSLNQILQIYPENEKALGLITTECASTASHRYLQLTVHGDSNDPRTDDIGSDSMTAEGTADAGWGPHLIDANVGMGVLLTLVSNQSANYLGQ